MGGSRDDKRRKRALEDLRRGLARGDAEPACEGLLALGPPDREPRLLPVARLVAGACERARARGQWSAIVPWAKRVEREPRLVAALDAQASRELLWALVWGCGRTAEWARAERFWRDLSPAAAAEAPALAAAMDGWIASRGAPATAAEIVARFAPPAPDPRLGIEPVGPRVRQEPSRPRGAGEVERALVRAWAELGARAFEPWVLGALDGAGDEAVASAIGETAAAMALREALSRVASGAGNALAPLSLVAACAERSAAAEAHAPAALRLVLGAIAEETSSSSPPAVTVAAVVRACAEQEALALSVRDALVGLAARVERPPAVDALLAAIGALAGRAPDAVLWATAAALVAKREPRAPGPGGARRDAQREREAAWLERDVDRMIGSGEGLAAWLAGSDKPSRSAVLGFVADLAPVAVAVRVIRSACARLGGDDALRRGVASCVERLLERLSAGRGEDDVLEDWSDLSPAAKQAWESIEDAALGLSPWLLEMALERAPSSAARSALLDRYVAAGPPAPDWVEAIGAARRHRLRKAPRVLLEQMLRRFAGDAPALAAAYEEAWGELGSAGVVEAVGRALVDALDAGGPSPSPRVAALGETARRFLARRRSHAAQLDRVAGGAG